MTVVVPEQVVAGSGRVQLDGDPSRRSGKDTDHRRHLARVAGNVVLHLQLRQLKPVISDDRRLVKVVLPLDPHKSFVRLTQQRAFDLVGPPSLQGKEPVQLTRARGQRNGAPAMGLGVELNMVADGKVSRLIRAKPGVQEIRACRCLHERVVTSVATTVIPEVMLPPKRSTSSLFPTSFGSAAGGTSWLPSFMQSPYHPARDG